MKSPIDYRIFYILALANFTKIMTKIAADPTLEISTDKENYQRGETVAVVVKNDGNKALAFPDTALGLKITSAIDGQQIYQWLGGRAITYLQPGESKQFTWKIEDNLQSGPYLASLSSLSLEQSPALSAEADFTINMDR
jgi:hypothetical protein